MACVLKDSLNNTLPNERKKVENVFTFSAFFIGKHCFCRHKSKIQLTVAKRNIASIVSNRDL